jgi:hypothetical protein
LSVTINFAGNTAVLADGQWVSANERLRYLLNAHLAGSQLEVPGHLPPGDRELELARLACRELGGRILSVRKIPAWPYRMKDGRPIVF